MKSKNYIIAFLVMVVIVLSVIVIIQEVQSPDPIISQPTATPEQTTDNTGTPGKTAEPTTEPTSTTEPTGTPAPTPTPTSTLPIIKEIDVSQLEGLDTTEQSWWYGYVQDGKMIYEIPAAKRRQLESYEGIYKKNDKQKVVYLTFDEGYENGYTAKILDTLKEKNVKAIFFVTGAYIRSSPELVKRMVEEGHLVGNHTDKHPNMSQVSVERFIKELVDTEKLYEQLIGEGSRMYYYRPPEGAYSERDLNIAKQMGYKATFWSFAYLDYDTNNQKGYEYAYNKITESLHQGEVFLLHAVSKDNADVLGDVIDYIRAQGYEIRRIDE